MLLVMMMLLTVVQTRVIFLHKETSQDAVPHYLRGTPNPRDRVVSRGEAGSLRYLGTPWPHGRKRTDAIFDPNCDPTERNVKLLTNSGRVNIDISLSPGQASQNVPGQQKSSKHIVKRPGVIWSKNVDVDGRALKDTLNDQIVQTPSDGRKGGKAFERTPGVTWNTKDDGRVGKHNSIPVSAGSDLWTPGVNFEKRRGSHDVGRRPGVPWSRTVDGGMFPSSTVNRAMGAKQFDVDINPMMDFIGTVVPFYRPRTGPGAPTPLRILSHIHHSHGQWPEHSHVLRHFSFLRGSGRHTQTSNPSPFIVQRLLVTPKPIRGVLPRLLDQSQHATLPTSTPTVSITNRQFVPDIRAMSGHTPTVLGDGTNKSRNRKINRINQSLGSMEIENINRVSSTSSTVPPFKIATAISLDVSTAKPFEMRTATPLEEGTAKPFEVRTATRLEARTITPSEKSDVTPSINTATPFEVRSAIHPEVNTAKPFEVRTATPLEASTAKPFEVRTATPFEASTAKPFEVRTASHPEINIATSLEVSSAKPMEVRTATPLGTETITSFEGSTFPNSVQSTGLPSTMSPSSVMTPTADAQDVEIRHFDGLIFGTSGTLASNALLHERLSSQWQSLGQRMQEIANKVNGGGTVTQQTR